VPNYPQKGEKRGGRSVLKETGKRKEKEWGEGIRFQKRKKHEEREDRTW